MFDRAFRELTGYAPMPWQAALYERCVKGDIPASCSLPTGLGKTSIIPIWLIALAAAPNSVPRRLVYVVNRRTVVDQATREAERVRANLQQAPELSNLLRRLGAPDGSSPVAVSTLRGQLADNREWQADPARPAIVVGTVDMIGSRLLFGAYRAGAWQAAHQAGLIGHDALIVHDEAHLEPAFEGLIRWLAERQASDHSLRPVQVMAMSATTRDGDQPVFTLGDRDLEHPVVRQRFSEVKKALCLHPHDPKASKLVDDLARLALVHTDENVRVIVYARRPEDAKKVRDSLVDKLPDGDARVALLTGTVRGHEREGLSDHAAVRGLLNSHDAQGLRIAPERTTWLVATSAGEVGADFDADHMVCDLAPADAMIQRFGRVNRRGGANRSARIDVVLEKRKDKNGEEKELGPFDQARLAAEKWLGRLPDMPRGDRSSASSPRPKNASPKALRDLVDGDAEAYAKACSPQPVTITPHEVVLDAWSLTSIQDDWPLAHELPPYLHGLDDPEPETYVAWRAEVDELPCVDGPDSLERSHSAMQAILRHYPLRPRELLREKPERVAEFLQSLRGLHPTARIVHIRQRTVFVQLLRDLSEDEKQVARKLRYETVVIPQSVGGLDDMGMLDTRDSEGKPPAPVSDVADLPYCSGAASAGPDRRRVLLMRDDEGVWRYKILAGPPAGDASPSAIPQEGCAKWTGVRERAAQDLGMKCLGRVVLSEDDEGPRRMLLFLRRGEQSQTGKSQRRTPLGKHNNDARQVAERMAKALNLGPALAEALSVAAGSHDLGKADPRWQEAIGNTSPSEPLAKSFAGGLTNWPALNGYRHEFGSLVRMDGPWSSDEIRDLALHLVASHHGRGRPHFDERVMADAASAMSPLLCPAEMASRFARLQRKYGHWGVAWLESILMAADAEASAAADAEIEEDEA